MIEVETKKKVDKFTKTGTSSFWQIVFFSATVKHGGGRIMIWGYFFLFNKNTVHNCAHNHVLTRKPIGCSASCRGRRHSDQLLLKLKDVCTRLSLLLHHKYKFICVHKVKLRLCEINLWDRPQGEARWWTCCPWKSRFTFSAWSCWVIEYLETKICFKLGQTALISATMMRNKRTSKSLNM